MVVDRMVRPNLDDRLRRRQESHRYLVRLRAEEDVEAKKPMTPDEESLAEIADWDPAEYWSDWADGEK